MSRMQHQRPALYKADVANIDGWIIVALKEQGRMSLRELRDVLGLGAAANRTDPLLREVRKLIAAGVLGCDGGMNAPGPTRPFTLWLIGGGS